jgi:hypothetical protein
MIRIDWQAFLDRLAAHQRGTHHLLPPCPEERTQALEKELGRLPGGLVAMLRHFNGADLFVKTGPLASLFGVSLIPPLPPSAWAPDWYIDVFVRKWRAAGRNKDLWPIGMMNYGVLVLIDANCVTREWDVGRAAWSERRLDLAAWLEALLDEGETYLAES